MLRRSILQTSGLASLLAAGVAPAVHAQASVRWRLASSYPVSQACHYGAAGLFARKVRQLSGGRFDISVHPAGELLPAARVLDAVRHGAVEAAHAAPHHFADRDAAFALGGAIPFGLNSRQMTAWTFEGQGLRLMREIYAAYNIIHFPCGNTGASMGVWTRQPIATVHDLRGLRIHVGPGLASRVLERLGAVACCLPVAQVIAGLDKGRIDAAESIGPLEDRRQGVHRRAPHGLYPGWWEGGQQLDLLIHRQAFQRLSSEQQAIVQAASAHAHAETQARHDHESPLALRQLVAEGARLRPFPNDLMTEAFLQAMALYDDLSARNPGWRKVYADYARFRADQNLWFRFSEARFDGFMQDQALAL